ncbi:HD domain-containing phosphohydrolase [Vibrio sinaloensis]|nr:HD domain-containing phosphohydrolase [Vibrio sinaloensis]
MTFLKSHSEIGSSIFFKDVDFPWPIIDIVEQHHERLDGSGYPKGLKGNQILMEARIVAVADTFDAMASDRPYRKSVRGTSGDQYAQARS